MKIIKTAERERERERERVAKQINTTGVNLSIKSPALSPRGSRASTDWQYNKPNRKKIPLPIAAVLTALLGVLVFAGCSDAAPGSDVGFGCTDGTQCSEGLQCLGPTGAKQCSNRSLGSVCVSNNDCTSALCDNNSCVQDSGGACTKNAECRTGLQCAGPAENKQCSDGSDGSACNSSTQCASGLCDGSACCETNLSKTVTENGITATLSRRIARDSLVGICETNTGTIASIRIWDTAVTSANAASFFSSESRGSTQSHLIGPTKIWLSVLLAAPAPPQSTLFSVGYTAAIVDLVDDPNTFMTSCELTETGGNGNIARINLSICR